ncbi:MAG TPA: PEP-CTERM sorting domain-containing protein [Rubrivivax sp.]|nr:PEP-CTERM sorting domain-containing protein [Rubrivivax sp.]
MNLLQHPQHGPGRALRCAMAAALLAGVGLFARAAPINFDGTVDSGPLNDSAFSGSFSYADPLPGYDGSVDLDVFSLQFDGQSYSLLTTDPLSTPVAWFAGGNLLGVDYLSDGSVLPQVSMLAGFTDTSEASFGYDTSGKGIEGFGSINFQARSSVPEPATLALALASLALLGATARRRR